MRFSCQCSNCVRPVRIAVRQSTAKDPHLSIRGIPISLITAHQQKCNRLGGPGANVSRCIRPLADTGPRSWHPMRSEIHQPASRRRSKSANQTPSLCTQVLRSARGNAALKISPCTSKVEASPRPRQECRDHIRESTSAPLPPGDAHHRTTAFANYSVADPANTCNRAGLGPWMRFAQTRIPSIDLPFACPFSKHARSSRPH